MKTFAEVVDDAQSALRNMFPVVGEHRVTGPAVKMSETPGRVGAPAPALGEHTRSVLSDLLGIDSAAVDALAADGIVFGGDPIARAKTAI